MDISYSFIIPVYNRPDEVAELLQTFTTLESDIPFEIVIVEDGSTEDCREVIAQYPDLDITYLYKDNSGPGSSRNYGMRSAKGNYFIILDSDCMLPSKYLKEVNNALLQKYVDFYGGPDAAHTSFSPLQKAINYSMTSFLTTGGLRGGGDDSGTFQPRSFNMGLSQEAFKASGGFGDIHPGEDPDLVLRLWKMGFTSRLVSNAYVYHKRRISWRKFYNQVHKFGLVRPILNSWHPHSERITYWFPTIFMLFLITSIIFGLLGHLLLIIGLVGYLLAIMVHSSFKNHSALIGILSVFATLVQFYGYGSGYLKSTIAIKWLGALPRKRYPHLFFNDVV